MINNDSNTTDANAQGASKTLSIGGKKTMANSSNEKNISADNRIQRLENLPTEFLEQPRFFKVNAKKEPLIDAWNKPENQRPAAQVNGLKGFDTCGHGRADDYLMIDCDHVLDDNGEFVTDEAEKWYNFITQSFDDVYCERSISGHGLHIFAKPTPNKFQAISAGRRGTLYFGKHDTGDEKKSCPKIELFYQSAARYCLVTGTLFRDSGRTIPAGAVVDDVFQTLLDEIQRQIAADTDAKKKSNADTDTKKSVRQADKIFGTDDFGINREYDEYRAAIMLDCISPADLADTDWLAVNSSCKNLGISFSVVDAWNSRDPARYDEAENQKRWDSLKDPSYDIETLHGIAKRFGYDEKSTRREWYQLHPELSTQSKPPRDEKNPAVTSATTGDAELDELLAEWRNAHDDSPIDPKIISEIKAAKEFVDNLTAENVTTADVASLKTCRQIALLKVYAPTLAKNFYDVLHGQKVISLTDFKKTVSKLMTGIGRAQKNYQEAEQKRFDKQRELACKNNNSGKRTRDTISDCPVNLIVPADFVFDGRGINAIRFSRGEPYFDSVTRTPIVVTRKFKEVAGTIQYEFAILSDGKWRSIEVDGGALADPRELSKILCRNGALIDSKDLLIQFFNDFIALNSDIDRVRVYNRTGWTDDDCTEFIIPGNGDFVLRRAGFNFGKIFATKGKADVWKDMYRKLLKAGGAISAMAVGTSLVAPLTRLLNIPNVQMHLHGKSGAAKTALQKFAASIYGDPSQLLRTFAATSKNRQTVADAFNDLPTFFDELETGRDKSAELNLCSDVYRYSGGKLGEANKRNGDARDASEFKGARLMTGERQILKSNALQGAFKRLVQIETRRGIFDDFAADIHLVAENNFGHFGRQWLNFIIEHADEIKRRYFALATTIIKAAKRYEETQIKSVVAIIVAAEFFDMMIENRADFSERDTFELAAGIVETLPTINDIDDCTRALNDLRSHFDTHEKYFLHGTTDERDNSTYAIETYGKIFKDKSIGYFPTALVKILEQDLGYVSADKLIREFASKGLLRRGEADRCTCKRTIGNKRSSVYLFNPGVIVEADDSEDEYYDRAANKFAD